MSDSHSGPSESSESSESTAAPEAGLRPKPGLEIIEGREFLAENVAISGRHFIRCSFNFCNLIYSGGPVGLVECGGTHNELIEVGPVKEAMQGLGADVIRDKMLRYWREVRKGLNLEVPPEA
ncbi:MAG TPA: hypothetical protein VHO02_05460 [Fibrobacteria bacterium]|nr:hypothetical protein [Fibrobacteria bacterium]